MLPVEPKKWEILKLICAVWKDRSAQKFGTKDQETSEHAIKVSGKSEEVEKNSRVVGL